MTYRDRPLKAKIELHARVTSGIGEELANLLASAGFNVVLVGRNADKLTRLKRSFEAEYRVAVKTAAADLSKVDEYNRLLQLANDVDLGLFVGSAGSGTLTSPEWVADEGKITEHAVITICR